jgi:hypothetical protein
MQRPWSWRAESVLRGDMGDAMGELGVGSWATSVMAGSTLWLGT